MSAARPPGAPEAPLVVLYDGVCGLCDRLVRFVLPRDARDRFRFAPLQGGFARALLARHGRDPDDLDTFYLVVGAGGAEERLLARSDAALAVLAELGAGWRALAALGRPLPRALRDRAYGAIAARRYRLFGRYESCRLPRPEEAGKFMAD